MAKNSLSIQCRFRSIGNLECVSCAQEDCPNEETWKQLSNETIRSQHVNSDDQDGVGQILQPKSGWLPQLGSVRVRGNICNCLSAILVSCNAPAFANYSMHCEYLLRGIPKAFRASIGRPLQLAGAIEILDPLISTAPCPLCHWTGRFERHGAAGWGSAVAEGHTHIADEL